VGTPKAAFNSQGVGTPRWQLARRKYRRLEDARIGHLTEEGQKML
jgi:hypothetical protein